MDSPLLFPLHHRNQERAHVQVGVRPQRVHGPGGDVEHAADLEGDLAVRCGLAPPALPQAGVTGDRVEPRREFIDANAKYVKNLDY